VWKRLRFPQRREDSPIVREKVQEMATKTAAILLALAIAGGIQSQLLGAGNQGFGFNASLVSGFPGGRAAEMSGGGGFRCLSNIAAGPFAGCSAGQGVRWDTATLLASTMFQCTGADAIKTAFTGDKTVVLLADFYRQGDGNIESFTAKMIVSDSDLDPVAPGVQNVWIQGIGCATDAVTSFN
jgi:hypothetical protein